jgi:hypothetical protein
MDNLAQGKGLARPAAILVLRLPRAGAPKSARGSGEPSELSEPSDQRRDRLEHGLHEAVIDRLKSKGEQIASEDPSHLSPANYDHMNPYGRYQFEVDRCIGTKPVRPINL